LLERTEPALDVDVGGRRDGKHVAAGDDAHAGRVACVERAVLVQVADVVRSVAGGRKALEPEYAVARGVDILVGDCGKLAPEGVEVRVEAARARLEAARVDDVGRADLGDVHLQVGMLADERPGGPRVVEVDVGQQEMPDVLELVAALSEAGLQGGGAARWAAVVEGKAGAAPAAV